MVIDQCGDDGDLLVACLVLYVHPGNLRFACLQNAVEVPARIVRLGNRKARGFHLALARPLLDAAVNLLVKVRSRALPTFERAKLLLGAGGELQEEVARVNVLATSREVGIAVPRVHPLGDGLHLLHDHEAVFLRYLVLLRCSRLALLRDRPPQDASANARCVMNDLAHLVGELALDERVVNRVFSLLRCFVRFSLGF
jgi:hypothetical protein